MNELSLKTWNGSANILYEEVLPVNFKHFDYPANFAQQFNENPIQTFQHESKNNEKLNECETAANFLFYCSDIYPKSITEFVFNQKCPFNKETFLFSFFSSLSLEYIDFIKALSICCSHIAFPSDVQQTEIILISFIKAFLSVNPYIRINENNLLILSKALIFMSGLNIHNEEPIPQKQFHAMINKINVDEQIETSLYNSINKNPVPLFFTFCNFIDPPGYKKTFHLKKKGGLFKNQKDRYFIIDSFIFKYYKDKTLRDQAGELDIGETFSEFVPRSKKEHSHIITKNVKGEPIGYKISKKTGERKRSNHSEYLIYGDDDEVLKEVVMTLNLLSYLYALCDSLRIN